MLAVACQDRNPPVDPPPAHAPPPAGDPLPTEASATDAPSPADEPAANEAPLSDDPEPETVRVDAPVDCGLLKAPRMLPGARPPAWIQGGDASGPCAPPPLSGDPRISGRSAHGLFQISTNGPQGSGRYWDVDVRWGPQSAPVGFCLVTSTVAWRGVASDRSLTETMLAMIRWAQDVDGDGQDELVVPASFPLRPEASMAEYGLMATVYKRRDNWFIADGPSTAKHRRAMAEAYQRAANAERRATDRAGYRYVGHARAARVLRACSDI